VRESQGAVARSALTTILIVDDDEDIRAVLGYLMADEGYRVMSAANVKRLSIRYARHHRIGFFWIC